MKVKVYYKAIQTMEVELPEEFEEFVKNDDYMNPKIEDVVEHLERYISQIDPNFVRSLGMIGIDNNIDWDWD